MNSYKYGRSHYISTVRANLGVPPIPEAHRDASFMLVVRNTGSVDASVWMIGSAGDQTELIIPANYDGLLMDRIGYDVISRGFEGKTSSSTTNVFINIIEQKNNSATIVKSTEGAGIQSASEPQFVDTRTVEVYNIG